MTTIDIFTKFLRLYPEFQDKVRDYADLESNSILINLNDGDAFEFIFDDNDHYNLALYANPYKPRKSRKPCLLRFISMIIVIALLGLIGWGLYVGAKSYTGNDIFIETTEEPTTEEIPETTRKPILVPIEPVTTEPTTEPPTEPEAEPTTKPVLVPSETIPTTEPPTEPNPTEAPLEPVETPETTENNSNINEDDVELLAIAIYQEVGSDACCDDCRRRVADVILNRVESEYFPNTIYEVLTQRSQYGVFYWTGVVWPERASYSGEAHAVERARRIAREVLEGNHSELYGKGYIWQAGFVQGTSGFWHCGIYFGRN